MKQKVRQGKSAVLCHLKETVSLQITGLQRVLTTKEQKRTRTEVGRGCGGGEKWKR